VAMDWRASIDNSTVTSILVILGCKAAMRSDNDGDNETPI